MSLRQVEHTAGDDVALDLRGPPVDRRAPNLKERRRDIHRPKISHNWIFYGCVAARCFDQQLIERLQQLRTKNLDHRRVRPETSLVVSELHRMAEQGRQRRDIDACCRFEVPRRSRPSSALAMRHPSLSWPTRFSAGTTTSSKNTSLSSPSPAIVRIGLILMPGLCRSSNRKLMPAWRGCACGSVRTSANIQSE